MATKIESLEGAGSQPARNVSHATLDRSLKSFARCAGTLSLGLLGFAALAPTVAAQNTNVHYLTVSAWFDDGMGGGGTSATLSDAEADVMFAGANAVVLPADQEGDIACDHTLGRSGSVVGIHGTGSDGDVDSAEEFDYVLRGPTFVKVVPLISFCSRLEPGIAGCAPVGGGANSLMLAEWAAKSDIGGVALAHEFGHVVGLNHEEYLVWNFMQPVASADNRNVSAEQCALLRSDSLDSDGPDPLRSSQRPASFALVNATRVPYTELGGLSIDELAHSYFFGRTPVEVEDTYGESDLYRLLQLLQLEEERDYHPTIATLIGLLGGAYGDGPADALISYIDRHPGTAASRVALSALGHLAAYGNQYALDTLIANAQPDSFYGPAAVVGLGVSGRAEARGILQALTASAVSLATSTTNQASVVPMQARAATYGPELSRLHRSTVLEAVSVNQAIASMGRRGYYRD
jgi:hypothetical protein